jgi:hypothetical protein
MLFLKALSFSSIEGGRHSDPHRQKSIQLEFYELVSRISMSLCQSLVSAMIQLHTDILKRIVVLYDKGITIPIRLGLTHKN